MLTITLEEGFLSIFEWIKKCLENVGDAIFRGFSKTILYFAIQKSIKHFHQEKISLFLHSFWKQSLALGIEAHFRSLDRRSLDHRREADYWQAYFQVGFISQAECTRAAHSSGRFSSPSSDLSTIARSGEENNPHRPAGKPRFAQAPELTTNQQP